MCFEVSLLHVCNLFLSKTLLRAKIVAVVHELNVVSLQLLELAAQDGTALALVFWILSVGWGSKNLLLFIATIMRALLSNHG